MDKLSTRNIQIFLAGALAVRGIRSLIAVPYFLCVMNGEGFYPTICSMILPFVFSLALPLGIGLLLNRPGIFGWAQVYLLLEFAIGLGLLVPAIFHHSTSPTHAPIYWGNDLDLPIPLLLFALLTWSRSKRFTNEPDTKPD